MPKDWPLTPEQLERYAIPDSLSSYFSNPEDYRTWIKKKAASLRRFDAERKTKGEPKQSIYKNMLLKLFKEWDGKCYYTGIRLRLIPTIAYPKIYTAVEQIEHLSIDHVFVENELQFRICSMKFNSIKESKPSVAEFLEYAKSIGASIN